MKNKIKAWIFAYYKEYILMKYYPVCDFISDRDISKINKLESILFKAL